MPRGVYEHHDLSWDDARIERLRTLWDEGLSTAEIGRRLGMSKNAVVGKARRLGLPARASPILGEREDAAGIVALHAAGLTNTEIGRRVGMSWTGVQNLLARMAGGPPRAPRITLAPLEPAEEPLPAKQEPPVVLKLTSIKPAAVPIKNTRGCLYPLWTVKDALYREAARAGVALECGEPRIGAAASYCEEHARMCNVRVAGGRVP